jgi:hypothetical protein
MLQTDDLAGYHGEITRRPLPLTPGSEHGDFEQIQAWLKCCLETHVSCAKPSPNKPFPTRVIDVKPLDDMSEPNLVEGCGQTGSYIALSHCSGGNVPLTATIATLPKRKRYIALTSMPKDLS